MSDKENDFSLIRRFSEGDEVAFNLLLRRYQQKIYWHARKMTGNHMDADEIVQEVMLVLYKSLKDFKYQSAFSTWLFRIITTRTLNFLKRRRLKEIFSIHSSDENDTSGIENIAGERTNIADDLENRERLMILDRVLKGLPAKQREIFVMRHFDEMSYEEISEITGKSVGGLKANYHHAFAKVNEIMRRKYDE
ncbi:MAG: RNA polymerase sigma factor [Ignavibacteriaceae bacterium]